MPAHDENACQTAEQAQIFQAYPTNIFRTQKSRPALQSYRERLVAERTEIFVKDKNRWLVSIWDPLNSDNVMPAILDFVFDLRLRVESPPTGRLRIDDAVVSRPQHAFNLSAFERQFKKEDKDAGPGDPNPWKRRAATFFHAYDTAAGASLFLVVKGTTLLHERLVSATRLEDGRQQPEGEGTDYFRAALDAHLLVLEWAMESWPQYIDYLVKKTREQVSAVDDLEISELDAEDAAQLRTSLSAPVHGLRHTPRSMGPPSRGGTGLSRASTMTVATVRKVGSWLTGRDTANNNSASRAATSQMAECEEKGDDDNDEHLADSFGFGSLQELNLLQDSVGEAAMTLREDLRIVRALATRYERLGKRHQELATEVAGFVEQIYVVLGELEGYQERIEALEEKLKRKAAMFGTILEHRNTHAGQHFAECARASSSTMEQLTHSMHHIALKTKHETTSMHVITFFTLIFLPGTFVSTLFSSNVMVFERDQGGLGDWEVREPALKLFLLLCFLLMGVLGIIWGATYRIGSRGLVAVHEPFHSS
ncbi:uncharacterized protein E0L32_004321 [Thyridium curvatum]|uniref:CorA-like transporter domain-containing protein n=1 Tax=Thyridium curvatum TaxID=1093900 RepID=A0A507B7F2_9PEZI|nr:uncharacterized protein E0L32_004321 [Thyridium curvatum]TPX15623.1 hypothetical protein E0L32_004321 [Thyridium curvatum]